MDYTKEVVPVTGVVPLDKMMGDSEEDTKLLQIMASGAKHYLSCFPWCRKILSSYFGDGYGGVVGVFLFHIEPSREGVDEWLWVIFGDVPPAFLVIDISHSPSQALECYILEVSRWVDLAKQGRTSDDVMPVYVPATPENAFTIETRVKLLKEVIVPSFREAETMRA